MNEYRQLLYAIDDDIEEDEITVYICPYCGLQLFDDSSYLPTYIGIRIGGKTQMHEHIVSDHLEDLKSDYGCEGND